MGSILLLSSCASSDLDVPKGWEDGKSFKVGWMIGCKKGLKVRDISSKKAKKSYCDCLFQSIMSEYPTYESFKSDLKVYGKKPFYGKAEKECLLLLEE